MRKGDKNDTKSGKIFNGAKKIIPIILILAIFSDLSAYALESALPDKRNEIFEESKNIRALLSGSKDIVLISSMWDSCILAMTQLDAYFVMVSIFNTIKQDQVGEKAVDYLITWLKEIGKTSKINMESLDKVTGSIDSSTEVHRAVLKVYFKKLNKEIDAEIERVSLLKKSLKLRQ